MTNQLFFELLHEARRIRFVLGWDWKTRRGYLLGMMRAYLLHMADLEIADNMTDYWKHQNSGAEGG